MYNLSIIQGGFMKFYTLFQVYHGKLYVQGYENGLRFRDIQNHTPFLFIPSKNPAGAKYRTLDGKPVDRIDFASNQEELTFKDKYSGIEGFEFYGMTGTLGAYSRINEIFSGDIEYDPSLIRALNFDIETSKIGDDGSAGFPDINAADKPITSITITCQGKTYTLGYKDFDNSKGQTEYIKCSNEENLLYKFVDVWTTIDPDVVTGWNIEYFDIPYIYNRICKLLGKQVGEKLSPFKKILRNDAEIHGRMINMVEILGVVTLDYMKIYKKFSFTNQESYSLNHISHVELNEKKLDYSDYEDLQDLYERNYQQFIEYNIKDVWLVERLEEKLGLLQQIYAMTYDAKVNYIDTLATVRIWDVIIHNHLMKKNIVIPDMKFAKPGHTIIGGHVKEVVPGMYKWVVSVDLDSLYPHLIMQYNISPETFVDQIEEFKQICFGTFDYESKKYQIEPNGERCVDLIFDGYIDENKMKILKNQNVAFSGSGCLYNRSSQGFLPYLMETMYNDRKAYKKKMLKAEQELEVIKKNKAKYNNYDELVKLKTAEIARNHNMQQAKKIQLNSVYGALSNKYFRWYDIQLAESITASGQLSIRFIANALNKYLNNLLKSDDKDYVIAIDTDSVYLNMEDLVDRLMPNKPTEDIVNFLDMVCDKKITPFINSQYQILADNMNAYQQKMNMSREVIADKGVWTAKKRYILNVWDKEGTRYNEAKHKMMGIEAVRSSTPEVVRNYIKDAIYILMNEDEDAMTSFISKCRDEFKKLAFEDVASPRTCNNLKKYTGKDGITFAPKIPIQVRGAGIYNNLLKEKGLATKYELINEGDKIKYCYLKTPNPTKSNVVSVPGVLPRELGLENYIDYNEQFDKNFIAPIKKILDAIDWPVEKRLTLDEFFT